MSYDIWLEDPVTGKKLEVEEKHHMYGGTYALGGTTELWLNITYNYAPYYNDATENDTRFAHQEVTAYYADGSTGPIKTEYGIRGLHGKSGTDSIPMLEDMIERITKKYKVDGDWITTQRTEYRYLTEDGQEFDNPFDLFRTGLQYTRIEYTKTVSEGPDENYWEPTAANVIKPLFQLIAMAKMRPDGIWNGD